MSEKQCNPSGERKAFPRVLGICWTTEIKSSIKGGHSKCTYLNLCFSQSFAYQNTDPRVSYLPFTRPPLKGDDVTIYEICLKLYAISIIDARFVKTGHYLCNCQNRSTFFGVYMLQDHDKNSDLLF